MVPEFSVDFSTLHCQCCGPLLRHYGGEDRLGPKGIDLIYVVTQGGPANATNLLLSILI